MITDHNQRSKKTKLFEKNQNQEFGRLTLHNSAIFFDKNLSETKTFPWWVSFYR